MLIGFSIFAVLVCVVAVLQRMAAYHIDLAKITEDEKEMYRSFGTKVRPSLSNVKPNGRRIVICYYVVMAIAALVLIGTAASSALLREPSPAEQRWGIKR